MFTPSSNDPFTLRLSMRCRSTRQLSSTKYFEYPAVKLIIISRRLISLTKRLIQLENVESEAIESVIFH